MGFSISLLLIKLLYSTWKTPPVLLCLSDPYKSLKAHHNLLQKALQDYTSHSSLTPLLCTPLTAALDGHHLFPYVSPQLNQAVFRDRDCPSFQ